MGKKLLRLSFVFLLHLEHDLDLTSLRVYDLKLLSYELHSTWLKRLLPTAKVSWRPQRLQDAPGGAGRVLRQVAATAEAGTAQHLASAEVVAASLDVAEVAAGWVAAVAVMLGLE